MSDDLALRFEGTGKMYKVFPTRLDNLLDALGAPSVRRRPRFREFWALRGIDLELRQGERLGIIGRNGAGKSTLLKLVTGNLAPTEGNVEVRGEVQALLEIGGGLHPEFTGRENIQASLAYLGLSADEIRAAENDIAEFTELGRFLEQPFKTYSQGMQARLSFGIATTVQPEILIVDEILGAGDAYFFTRSTSRMRQLIDGGATVLLVSHALDQIVRFCDEAIWLDRGRIVMRGESTEVVKTYERFVRELEDKRLLAANRKARTGRFDAFERESYSDQVHVELRAPTGACDVRLVALHRDGAVEDAVSVGDAQDADPTQSASVAADAAWSGPRREGDAFYRTVEDGPALAQFHLWFFYPSSKYAVEIGYRSPGETVEVVVRRAGAEAEVVVLPAAADWTTQLVPVHDGEAGDTPMEPGGQPPTVSRWPGEGSLMIEEVVLLDGEGNEQAVFQPGSPMTLHVRVRAGRNGSFPVTPAATMYRADGILVSNHVGASIELEFDPGATQDLRLDFGPLALGDGRYLFSIALYRALSALDGEPYDLIDRSYEFEVTGNGAFDNGVVRLPAAWSVVESRVGADAPAG